MSPCTTVTFSRSPRVSSNTGSSRSSSSMATTLRARLDSSAVSTPMPGPTSITPLSGVTPETSAIRGQTVGLMRKFWPRALEKVKPCRERMSLMEPIFQSCGIR